VPIDYRIYPDERLVWATAHGILTTADFFAYQRTVWERPDVQGYDELVDMRSVADIPAPSPTAIRSLASLAATMDPQGVHSKFAIIASDDFAYGLGRMYQTHRGLRGQGAKEVAVFRTIEEGLEWLGRDGLAPPPQPS
jgi:hypothetical protein